jgi:Chagasin family peptidase inhibitor I42
MRAWLSVVREVQLRVGESINHSLEGFGAAGYRWDFAIEQDVTTIVVERLPPVAPAAEGKAPDSYSVQEVFRIAGLIPGEATVSFFLRRPSEEATTAVEQEALKILVST